MQDLITRRRLDGSIDVDFYRQRGLMERRVVMTNFVKGAGRLARPLVAVAVLAAALSVTPRDGAGWNAPTASMTAPNGMSLVYPATADRRYALNATR